jgi:hypothetical protein
MFVVCLVFCDWKQTDPEYTLHANIWMESK